MRSLPKTTCSTRTHNGAHSTTHGNNRPRPVDAEDRQQTAFSGDKAIELAYLHSDPKNRRAHTPRNLTMIVDALKQVGAARSIVIDEDDVILAGNGVIAAAPDAGITKLRVIEADGQEIIAVRRRGLTPEQKRQ